jgi:hypothetical protein
MRSMMRPIIFSTSNDCGMHFKAFTGGDPTRTLRSCSGDAADLDKIERMRLWPDPIR